MITDDGSSRRRIGILDHKNELMDSLGLLVMSDIEAIEYIQKLIQVRDNSVYLLSERYGTPLPSWVGKD